MSTRARGTFETTAERQPPYDENDGAVLGRTSIKKQFQGDLSGSSTVEMLSALSLTVKGSAGYVALERVTGTLAGRTGTFVLQHNGLMTRGTPSLTVTVVPDTATGGLVGLAGTMAIDIVEGKHLYTFDYSLEAAKG